MMTEIEQLQTRINEALKQLALPESPSNLYDPIKYILQLGGKRVRPMLALLAYKLYKEDIKPAVVPALALEVFHNFTLVHDDIMDEAPLRRGKETVHKKWNENIAILSGDVMLVEAYKLLGKAPNEVLPKLLEKFNACAQEVCEGQQKDMDFESRPYVSVDEYLDMIRQKTAVLLGFSLEMGALLAGAPEKDCELLYEAGVNLGIAFQLQDDMLDLYGGEAFGKQIGGDIINRKKSFLITRSLELSTNKEALLRLYNGSEQPEQRLEAIKAEFRELAIESESKAYIDRFESSGMEKLERFSHHKNIHALQNMIDTLSGRKH